MTSPIKITLVEDNQEYREVIKLAISRDTGMELVSAFVTAEIAIRTLGAVGALKPDILLLDLRLPEMSGLEALPILRELVPDSKIIILSQSNQEADVLKAISLGANGYLLKSSTIAQIKEGIRGVAEGGASLAPEVTNYVLRNLRSNLPSLEVDTNLSDRELEVLRLLSDGMVKKEIGDSLNISYDTVDSHVRRIYNKLKVNSAPAAVSKAFRTGLFTPSDER